MREVPAVPLARSTSMDPRRVLACWTRDEPKASRWALNRGRTLNVPDERSGGKHGIERKG
jgi:hypothetical protein